jgi:NTE family protein
MYKGKRIGIALGGGGARGFAHWSVLRTLEKYGIVPDVVAGTSMGAVIAVAHHQNQSFKKSYTKLKQFVIRYAKDFEKMRNLEVVPSEDLNAVEKFFKSVNQSLHLFAPLTKDSVTSAEVIDNIMNDFIYPADLSDIDKKVYVCCLDMTTGQAFFTDHGNAQFFVKAAMSVPGYFPPVKFNDHLLYDAQGMYPVPLQVFEKDPVDILISVDVGAPIPNDFDLHRTTDLLFRQVELSYSHIISEVYHCSDVVIKPNLDNIHWTDFHLIDKVLAEGSNAVEAMIKEIDDAVDSGRPNSCERPWHNYGFEGIERLHINPKLGGPHE